MKETQPNYALSQAVAFLASPIPPLTCRFEPNTSSPVTPSAPSLAVPSHYRNPRLEKNNLKLNYLLIR